MTIIPPSSMHAHHKVLSIEFGKCIIKREYPDNKFRYIIDVTTGKLVNKYKQKQGIPVVVGVNLRIVEKENFQSYP